MKNDALKGLAILVLILIGIPFLIWFAGSENPESPAGYVGYVTQGAIFGKTQFLGLQTGPTSYGRSWLTSVVNVSITPYTYHEEFVGQDAVLAADNLEIQFRVHVVWRIKPTLAREYVEKYSILIQTGEADPDKVVRAGYDNFLQEPIRTFSRDEIQKLKGLAVKDNITPIGDRILARTRLLTDNTPFEIVSIIVGNIQYPRTVADAVSQKLAATQNLEQEDTQILIQEKKKTKQIIEAHGIAEAMRIINNQLTPLYVQHEAVKVQEKQVGSPNHTVMYLPVGPMGVPITGTIDMNAPKFPPKPARPDSLQK